MRIAVIGTGYVGLVVGACLADLGNEVTCADIAEGKINSLKKGEIPIYEPGLQELVEMNLRRGRLSFTTDVGSAVKNAEAVFIAVGTPQKENGEACLGAVKAVAETIGKNMDSYKVIINKSTVPVGTGGLVGEIISRHYKGEFDVVSNPEFLREGSAIKDFMEPERVVVGNGNPKAREAMERIYEPLDAPIIFTDIKTAEMIKYASNSFLATKISFINEIANLCDAVGADVKVVAEGMGADSRIGNKFLEAGCGYGGSCFPKDVKALGKIGENFGYDFRILKAVDEVNKSQKKIPVAKVKALVRALKGKRIAILGLAFKPGTDDMREAPSVDVIEALLRDGAEIRAFDPVAESEARRILPGITCCPSVYEAAKGAEAVVILTDWNEFREMDLEKLKRAMKGKVLIDGRNILDRDRAKELGFDYSGIGR